MADVLQGIARRRVTLGFVCGAVAAGLARPTHRSMMVGLAVAGIGEALRIWAAGHLEKGREVTMTGPYRFTRHPLYLGSSVMGVGLAVACRSLTVAVLIGLYLGATLVAASRSEEAFLRRSFGDRYDRYRRPDAGSPGSPDAGRGFSLAQAIANREHRAAAGLVLVLLLLLWKTTYN